MSYSKIWGILNGDQIIISSIIKKLKEDDYYIILDTTGRGREVFKEDTNIDEFINHDETIGLDVIFDFWKEQKARINPDKYINFSESLEMNMAMPPADPIYWEPKYVRFKECNRNYYTESIKWAGVTNCCPRPTLYFSEEEVKAAKVPIVPGRFNILWCLSGSGKNKVYPWTEYVMGEVLNNHKDVHFITVGDEKCQAMDWNDQNVTNLSGRIPMRLSMCLTQFVGLVISPDTGVLHASGAYTTPKIGLLGHTTIENITKTFINDYSIEADCACAPCFKLIYDHEIQCPTQPVTNSPWCLSEGLAPERVYNQIKKVIDEHR